MDESYLVNHVTMVMSMIMKVVALTVNQCSLDGHVVMVTEIMHQAVARYVVMDELYHLKAVMMGQTELLDVIIAAHKPRLSIFVLVVISIQPQFVS